MPYGRSVVRVYKGVAPDRPPSSSRSLARPPPRQPNFSSTTPPTSDGHDHVCDPVYQPHIAPPGKVMLPVVDFNYVVCGFATFAATVGYACTRKLAPSPIYDMESENDDLPAISSTLPSASAPEMSDTPVPPAQPIVTPEAEISEVGPLIGSPQPMESTPKSMPLARHESLKRKRAHDEHEETITSLEYPHNLKSIYPPKKRSRTPSSDSDNVEKLAEKSAQPAVSELPVVSRSETAQPVLVAPARELDEPTRSSSVPPEVIAPQPQAAPDNTAPSTPPSLPSPPSTPKPKTLPSCTATPRGFAAFAGSTSPFTSSITSSKINRSPWAEKAFSLNSPNEPDSSPVASRLTKPVRAFTDTPESPSKPAYTHVTGEENEEVELELKGVKLFVKRGAKTFSEGLVGHVKVLSSKESSGERILFRREPLWKVSMNVRLQPAVRCTYDEEENVLRLILTESSSRGSAQEDNAREVVVYAMKPGRSCSKQDFKEFASSVVDRSGLKK